MWWDDDDKIPAWHFILFFVAMVVLCAIVIMRRTI